MMYELTAGTRDYIMTPMVCGQSTLCIAYDTAFANGDQVVVFIQNRSCDHFSGSAG